MRGLVNEQRNGLENRIQFRKKILVILNAIQLSNELRAQIKASKENDNGWRRAGKKDSCQSIYSFLFFRNNFWNFFFSFRLTTNQCDAKRSNHYRMIAIASSWMFESKFHESFVLSSNIIVMKSWRRHFFPFFFVSSIHLFVLEIAANRKEIIIQLWNDAEKLIKTTKCHSRRSANLNW